MFLIGDIHEINNTSRSRDYLMLTYSIGELTHIWKSLHKNMPNALYGPAHSVLADGNLGDGFIYNAIKDIRDILDGKIVNDIYYFAEGHTQLELFDTAMLLCTLLSFSEEHRNYVFENWDKT